VAFGNVHFKTFSSNVSQIYCSVATTHTYNSDAILKLSNTYGMCDACIRQWWNTL